MATEKTRADYDALAKIVKQFHQESETIAATNRQLRGYVSSLENGDWVGGAAQAFFAEMNGTVAPALDRLSKALESASRVSSEILQDAKKTEEEIATVIKQDEQLSGGSSADATAGADATASPEGGLIPAWLKDLAEGALAGDFSDNNSPLKLLAQIVVGFIPIAGQIADVRDIIANIKNVVDGKEGAWIALGISVVAIIPGLDALKGAKAIEPILKAVGDSGARELIEVIIKNTKDLGLGRVSEVAGKLFGNTPVIEAIVKNPQSFVPMLRHGTPELIEALGKNPNAVESILKAGPDVIDRLAKSPDWVDTLGKHPALTDIVRDNLDVVDAVQASGKASFEDFAKGAANKLEAIDHGHSIGRHGPEIPMKTLEDRIKTGVAPDSTAGNTIYSPTRASTRFGSYTDYLTTRQEAFEQFARQNSIDLSKPPPQSVLDAGPNKFGDYGAWPSMEIDHGRAIDEGYLGIGTGSKINVPTASGGTKKIKVYPSTQSIDGVTGTTSTVRWVPNDPSDLSKGGNYVLKQHFPRGVKWNQATQQYDP